LRKGLLWISLEKMRGTVTGGGEGGFFRRETEMNTIWGRNFLPEGGLFRLNLQRR